jgi:hypothetical protein
MSYDWSHANVDASGLVGFPVIKSMTVPRRAKLEYGHRVDLMPDATSLHPVDIEILVGKGTNNQFRSARITTSGSIKGITGYLGRDTTRGTIPKQSNKPGPSLTLP